MGALFVGDGALDVQLIKLFFVLQKSDTPLFLHFNVFDFFTNFRNEQCSPVSFTANHLP